jgi:hypothetical protein
VQYSIKVKIRISNISCKKINMVRSANEYILTKINEIKLKAVINPIIIAIKCMEITM